MRDDDNDDDNNNDSAVSSCWRRLGLLLSDSVMCAVLPFCIVNCLLLLSVEWIEDNTNTKIGFSPNGHGLMTLLISFLVISKVNLAYDRFRAARNYTGNAFLHLRELNQLVQTLTLYHEGELQSLLQGSQQQLLLQAQTTQMPPTASTELNSSPAANKEEKQMALSEWRTTCVSSILDLLEATRTVIQDDTCARYLARNESVRIQQYPDSFGQRLFQYVCCCCGDSSSTATTTYKDGEDNRMMIVDPMCLVQALRIHFYMFHDLQLLERLQLLSKLNEYVRDYRLLLELVSTPLPTALVKMGRAFLFLWTFTMPLVLREGPFNDVWTAMIFLFFLTYGFIGLELVSMKLAHPFGTGRQDIQVRRLYDATLRGIETDLDLATVTTTTTTTTDPKGTMCSPTLRARRRGAASMTFASNKNNINNGMTLRQQQYRTQEQRRDGILRTFASQGFNGRNIDYATTTDEGIYYNTANDTAEALPSFRNVMAADRYHADHYHPMQDGSDGSLPV